MVLQRMNWYPNIMEEAGITIVTVSQLEEKFNEYMGQFDDFYVRTEQCANGKVYVRGLLSDLERKSVEPIALRYLSESKVRSLQHFVQGGLWNDKEMSLHYEMMLSERIAVDNGMITVDGSDFPKKGKESVGVARQYCGSLGKRENCQAGVFVGYSGKKGYGLIKKQLYIPKKWFGDDYEERRNKCGIPDDVVFKTKPQLAIDMIQEVAASGLFTAQWVGVDAAFGANKEFLDAIPQNYHYFADVPLDTLVFTKMPQMTTPEYSGRGRRDLRPKPSCEPVTVSSIIKDDSMAWSRVCLGEGAKGPIMADEMVCQVVDIRNDLPHQWVWLYIRRYADGTVKYALCNAPDDISLDQLRSLAVMRWPIEQCFEECKTHLGMDQYEGRSYTFWHRHMLFVFIAHLFLLDLRLTLKKVKLS